MLGILDAREEDHASARRHLEKSLSLAGDLDDPDARVAALNNLALIHGTGGETARAIELTGEALALCASMGDRRREAELLNNLADLPHAARCGLRSGSSPSGDARLYSGAVAREEWWDER